LDLGVVVQAEEAAGDSADERGDELALVTAAMEEHQGLEEVRSEAGVDEAGFSRLEKMHEGQGFVVRKDLQEVLVETVVVGAQIVATHKERGQVNLQ
jgi:hypothetical protein